MGAAKRELERIYEERWSPIEDGLVCTKCFQDTGLRYFILENSTSTGCNYCEDSYASRRKSCDINEVIGFISECIREHYEDPANSLPYESAEGGYYGAEVLDTYDLLMELLDTDNSHLWEDINSAFEMTSWCRRNPFADTPSDEMIYDWDSFSRYVKHENRYFFHRGQNKASDGSRLILSSITSYLKRNRLFKRVNSGQIFFRGRCHKTTEKIGNSIDHLGIPPADVLSKNANRMSPAGIPIFYGALEKETVISETNRKKGSRIKIAEFEVVRRLNLLDLTKLPSVPSIFSNKGSKTRDTILFLYRFRSAIMAKVQWDGREHTDYVPSQVFSEYIRHCVQTASGRVDGILYPSAQNKTGTNVALFISRDDIVSSGESKGTLSFNPQKVKTLKLAS
jgi:hypothetical protein